MPWNKWQLKAQPYKIYGMQKKKKKILKEKNTDLPLKNKKNLK